MKTEVRPAHTEFFRKEDLRRGCNYKIMSVKLSHSYDVTENRYPKFLDMLNEEDRKFLLARASEKIVGKEQLLYHQGDPSDKLFVILKGAVKVLYMQPNGSALTTSFYREGMLVGAHGYTQWAGNHAWSAQALMDCRLMVVRRADYLELLDQSPDALRCVIAIWEFKNELLKRVIRVLAEPTLEQRIAMAVRHLGILYGIYHGSDVEIDGHVTHQEIAEMVGASRQSVTSTLALLEHSGVIRRNGRRLFVPLADQEFEEFLGALPGASRRRKIVGPGR